MNISWSRFDALQTCSLKYDLIYQKRVKRMRPVLRFAPGLATHTIMEKWAKSGFRNETLTRGNVALALRHHLQNAKLSSPQQYGELLTKTLTAVAESVKVYIQLDIPNHFVDVEPRKTIPVGNAGDALIGGWDVFDKTARTIYDIKVSTSPTYGDTGQLETYALMASLQGEPVGSAAFISPLIPKKVRTHKITDEVLVRRQKLLMGALAAMKAGVRPVARPGKHCFLCDFNRTSHCPATFKSLQALS